LGINGVNSSFICRWTRKTLPKYEIRWPKTL